MEEDTALEKKEEEAVTKEDLQITMVCMMETDIVKEGPRIIRGLLCMAMINMVEITVEITSDTDHLQATLTTREEAEICMIVKGISLPQISIIEWALLEEFHKVGPWVVLMVHPVHMVLEISMVDSEEVRVVDQTMILEMVGHQELSLGMVDHLLVWILATVALRLAAWMVLAVLQASAETEDTVRIIHDRSVARNLKTNAIR